MSELFVRFPGTPSNYISTDDVNTIDADTAHLYQSEGLWTMWTGGHDVGRVADADARYGYAFQGTVTAGYMRLRIGVGFSTDLPAVDPAEPLTLVGEYRQDKAVRTYTQVTFYDSSGVNLGSQNIPIVDPAPIGWTQFAHTFTPPAGSAYANAIVHWLDSTQGGDAATDAICAVGASCLRPGSDPTFVPSLRIVGDLDETIDPPDMPIVFAGDGTPLTIGEGWAGDGHSYIRRDGVGGPVVARFDPADIVLP